MPASSALDSAKYVDGIKDGNERFVQAVRASDGKDEMCGGYAQFIELLCKQEMDANIVSDRSRYARHDGLRLFQKMYLLSSLGSLADEYGGRSQLVAARIRILASSQPALFAPDKVLRIVRRLACKGKTTSGDVWIARLEAESRFGSREDAHQAWVDARGHVKGGRVEEVWMWGVDMTAADISRDDVLEVSCPRSCVDGVRTDAIKGLLRDSMRDSSLRSIHGALLMRYVKGTEEDDATRIRRIRHVAKRYLITPEVWAALFAAESKGPVLEEIYRHWVRADGGEAALGWAGWLLGQGRGEAAKETISGQRGLEERWGNVLRTGSIKL